MVLFQTNFIKYLLLLLKCLDVITTASTADSKNMVNQNSSSLKHIKNKTKWAEMYENDTIPDDAGHNKIDFEGQREGNAAYLTPLKTYSDASLTRGKTVSNTPTIIRCKSLNYRQNDYGVSGSATSNYRQIDESKSDRKIHSEKMVWHFVGSLDGSVILRQDVLNEVYTVSENLTDNFKYRPQNGSTTTPTISNKRSMKDQTTSSGTTTNSSYCQNPSTSFNSEEHLRKKKKYTFASPHHVSTGVNSLIDNSFSSIHMRKFNVAKSDDHQTNTQRNLPRGGRYTSIRNTSQLKTSKIEIKCLNKCTKKRDNIAVNILITRNIYEIFVYKNPSVILYDTQYSLEERTRSHFCDYLFSINGFIVYRQSTGKNKSLTASIILKFDNTTNKFIIQDQDIKNSSKIIVLCPKIYFRVPIFVALNFTSFLNLQYFKLTTKRSNYGIICTVAILVSSVMGVVPNINHTFLRWGTPTYIFILKFILSANFPIYSLTILKNDSLWFSKKYPFNVCEFRQCMKIQEYFDSLKSYSLDFKTRINSYRYKEVKDLPTKAESILISLDIAEGIIFKTCISFYNSFKKIQSILNNSLETTEQKKLQINSLISNMLKQFEPNWCITYHENVNLSENICELISFYSFFYHEVKYVLEYCLKYGNFPLVVPEQ